MRSGRGVVLGLGVLAAFVLSGCTEVGSLVSKTGIDIGLQELSAQLEQIPSVVTVTPTVEITPDFGHTVDVEVVVDALVAPDILGIIDAVNATFASDAFLTVEELTFGVQTSGGARFTEDYPLSIPHDDLQTEVDYWVELSTAFGGSLSMSLYSSPEDGAGTYYREIVAVGDDQMHTPDWNALRSVPDPSKATRFWTMGGLWFGDAFPSDAVIELRAELAALALEDESIVLDQYWPDYVTVQFSSPAADLAHPQESSAWPRELAAVELLVAANLPLVAFAHYADGNQGPSNVHLGECDGESTLSATDDVLWAALVASNIDLPVGSGPGFCSHA